MMLFRAPGVYRPQADTRLLMRAVVAAAIPPGRAVLDLCTGTGALAVQAARMGAKSVTAVDISRMALLSAWLNSRVRGIGAELVYGDFAHVLRHRRFDAVVANPPYVPGPGTPPPRGRSRAWEAGPEGRAVLDPLCDLLPTLLHRDGTALVVHSMVCGADRTIQRLRSGGLKAAVVARETTRFGPVLRRRARWLESRGLLEPDSTAEELVVIRADRTAG
ncbi:methyltransferase [Nocardia terpenica]|uniref:methyltransferase n=1 Tax=Nocardia terpenica TaxID=455432 RepID=UPI001893A926|nr:methyltransferase [Nocardia terpenica]MBF6059274.1 methyltransferase [Nocardia terpenica]MBF6103187.1 methyltransferase [Nocardia terpenica]MBF6110624.1 methyltransferase [Nocardia terpenica]MBF6116755.1 methyltransferase [Nocardia terpenica]